MVHFRNDIVQRSICNHFKAFIWQRNDLALAKSRQPTTFIQFSLTFVWVNSLKLVNIQTLSTSCICADVQMCKQNRTTSQFSHTHSPHPYLHKKRQTHALVFENPIICKMYIFAHFVHRNIIIITMALPNPVNMHTFLANVQNQMENPFPIFCNTMQMEIRLFNLNHIHRKKLCLYFSRIRLRFYIHCCLYISMELVLWIPQYRETNQSIFWLIMLSFMMGAHSNELPTWIPLFHL